MSYLQTKGRIFDVQRYSIHDGPGIRTIVFLKGCVLRCRWCCNPESQEYGIQTMKVLGKDKVIGRDVTVEEMIKVVEQDRPYYRRSGGGLTLSGGESLCQPEFARDMLRAAKERGINTALESMACAPFETIETILPYLDLYLMDIKHTNPAKHKEFTGRANDLMMENARKVALSGKCKLVFRSFRLLMIQWKKSRELHLLQIHFRVWNSFTCFRITDLVRINTSDLEDLI